MKITIPKKNKKKSTLPKKIDENPAVTIKKLYVEYSRAILRLDDAMDEAFDRMFLFGQQCADNESYIKEEYGTWASFAEEEGVDKYAISRCKSSVQDFQALGANTVALAKELIHKRGLKPSAKLMEGNVRRLLENGQGKTPPKDKSVKRERDINEIRKLADRIHELVEDHDPDDEIYQEALELQEFAESSIVHINSLDVSQKQWSSQAFLNFCRNINYDAVLGKPVEKSEPMHIAPDGGTGSMGGKVADFYAIPGSRDTHNKLHSEKITLSIDEIADLHRWTMVQFILHHIPSDKTAQEIENIPQTEYEEE